MNTYKKPFYGLEIKTEIKTTMEKCRLIFIYESGCTYRHPSQFYTTPSRQAELNFLNSIIKREVEKFDLGLYLKEVILDFWKVSKVKHTFILNKKIYNLTKQIQFL